MIFQVTAVTNNSHVQMLFSVAVILRLYYFSNIFFNPCQFLIFFIKSCENDKRPEVTKPGPARAQSSPTTNEYTCQSTRNINIPLLILLTCLNCKTQLWQTQTLKADHLKTKLLPSSQLIHKLFIFGLVFLIELFSTFHQIRTQNNNINKLIYLLILLKS